MINVDLIRVAVDIDDRLQQAKSERPDFGRAGKRFDSAALCEPKAPVSEMVGNNEALTEFSRALALISVFSAWRTSGRRSSNAAGRPVGTSTGAGKNLSAAVARTIGAGFSPSRICSRFSVLGDLAFEVRQQRARGGEVRFSAVDVKPRYDTAAELRPGQFDEFIARLNRALRNRRAADRASAD